MIRTCKANANRVKHARSCFPKFSSLLSKLPTSPLRKLYSRAGSLSTTFLLSTICFFPCGGETGLAQTFPRLTTSLGALGTTPSRLGGFTSKSNKCFTDSRRSAQMLKYEDALLCSLIQILSTQSKGFSYNLTNLTKRGWGEL